MADNAESSGQNIKITVKTPKEKQEIEISEDESIKTLKEKVAEKFKAPIDQLCLIFAGKILKEGDTLEQHGIKNGLTVHLVIKSVNKSQEQAAQRSTTTSTSGSSTTSQPQQQQPNIGATPFGLGGMGGLAGMGNLGMGSANFMEMQQRMQREVMNNPEMLRQMMENPMVQQMMSNPDVMRQLITNNPQMRELMERNPEITHMLNNPELMRQTIELARNPSMLQELMRSQDRAMSNLESIPGGFNALQRMYRDIQEPMMNAAQEGFGGSNPFSSLVNNQSGNSSSDSSEQQGRENTNPLPNPWAPSSTSASSTSTTSSSTPVSGMFNTPGMQSLMSQMAQNPQLMQNMLQAPYMQTMMQTMSSNPELAQQIIESNPMFAGNPQLSENFRQYLPTMLQQMQNPDVQNMMTNPRAMEAIMQIQQGMQQLQSEAPGMFSGMNVPGMSMPPSSIGNSCNASPTSPTTTTTAASSGDTSTSTTSSTETAPTAAGSDALNNMMAQMVQMMAGGTINQPPEQRYASQLDQLATMGFVDREANIRALQATLGDVNAAVDRLLQQR